MKKKTLKSNTWTKVLVLLMFLNFAGFNLSAQKVLLDSHSAGNGSSTWTITTHYPNELIIISAGGYGVSNAGLSPSAGTVTVNNNNATYISEGDWIGGDSWCEAIWAYAAPTAGTYTCVCKETNLISPFYFNFASSVYESGCSTGLTLHDIVVGGVDSNHGPTTITATITTTENNSWIYGSIDNNDNGGTGTVAWNNQLTQLDKTYINDGVDGAQADSTYALAGSYTITSTDVGASNVWMTIALIAVQPDPDCCPLTATAGAKSNVSCNGGSNGSAFGTPAKGHTPYTYYWTPGKQTTDTITGLSAGTYTVNISDTVGCSATATVTISQPLPLSATITPANVICSTQTESGIANVTGGTGPYTYSWSTKPVQTADTATGLAASGTYTVNVTDSHGCTSTASVTINPIPIPKPIITTAEDTVCIGTSTILNVTGGNSYIWLPGSKTGSSDTVNPAFTTTYTVKATIGSCSHDTSLKVLIVPVPTASIAASKDSVCAGDSLTLEGSGGTTYLWSPGNSTNAKLTIKSLLQATTYKLYTYGGTCRDSDSVSIGIIQPITASIQITKDSICPEGSTTITALGSGGAASYRWSNGATTSSITVSDTVTTTYTVEVKGRCDSMAEAKTVVVVPLPEPVIRGNRYQCAGKDTITVSSNTNPVVYVWGNNHVGTSIVVNVDRDTVISVTAYNSLGCAVKDTYEIKEAGYPVISLVYPEACGTGNHVTITADTAGGSGPYKYSWSNGGTKDTAVVYVNKSGTVYTVTVTNEFGCSVTAAATVEIDNPDLSACCSGTILLGGDTELYASGAGISKFTWSPANSGLSCYECPDPVASPTVTTTYTVSGTDSADCPIERTVTIIVETPCYNFIVPNVFTPTNGGALGLDNVFYINASGFTNWSLKIYDRWGHTVYSSTDENKYWDGNNGSGANAPEGVYYYVIDASCTGSSFQKDGFVQLIR